MQVHLVKEGANFENQDNTFKELQIQPSSTASIGNKRGVLLLGWGVG
jgi:hypothetical protein